ncbi:ankyrin repeat domain-containing protein [Streptomyces sp. NPDC056470]|uniref:ankyrin repeat domain-containing protein n=1 Tax=Streptomyces sp. NPDC056470 TaxID=3345831 RepID=UPI0036CCB296
MTPLEKAVVGGDHKRVRDLLASGEDPRRGEPLFAAIEAGDGEMVRLLVEHGADLDHEVHAKPMLVWATTLATEAGDAIADYMIERGAQVDYVDYDDCNALRWAARRPERLDLVQHLADRGALQCLLKTESADWHLRLLVEAGVDSGDESIVTWIVGEIERSLASPGARPDQTFDPRCAAVAHRVARTHPEPALPPSLPAASPTGIAWRSYLSVIALIAVTLTMAFALWAVREAEVHLSASSLLV